MATEPNNAAEALHNGHFDAACIMGLGLIGASLAASLREAYPTMTIYGVDTDAGTRAEAESRGWVNRALDQADLELQQLVCGDCDLVVIATPVPTVPEYLRMLADWDYRGIITDTASTKAHISEEAQHLLPYPQNYLPGHPMAGSEVNGIKGARANLFDGAHWILCPDADTPAEHFTRLHELITGMGARVISLPRQDHDAAVAIVSHVPHFTAASLMTMASRHADDQRALMRLAAGGFKDSTRIAAGSPKLWTGIAFDNAQALSDGLAEMGQILDQFAKAIAEGDRETVTTLLTEAANARRALPAAWVPSTEDLLEVRIPMRDRKGVLAEATTIASSVGCNIQSIEIDHVTEDSAVLSMILTDEGDIGKLSLQLIKAGFSVSFAPLAAKEHAHVD
ncbi:MAG: prephenate dehydrogenase/arogenate dehydrogenase family protein [Coriobacteriia bacterium]|nr:prephenate dehydrogenase/arogenate dehydrogenase family protein [Coriobacteriia bacterium]